MGNYGTPLGRPGRAARAPPSGTSTASEYVDLFAGLAVNVLGHAHPAVAEAVDEAARHARPRQQPAITSRRSCSPSGSRTCTGFDKVLFTNSGAEANEAGLKLARRHRPGGGCVACEGAFHGRTMGALAVTGQPAKRTPFEPLPGPVTFVPYGDSRRPRSGGRRDPTASVVLEPVLGEAGVVVPPAGFLAAARAAADAHGALLHLDEVQGGIGRAGAWLVPPGPRARRAGRRGDPRQGARRRPPDRCAAGQGSTPRPRCRRATTARRSAATRSSAPPRSRSSTRSSRTACWSGRPVLGEQLRKGDRGARPPARRATCAASGSGWASSSPSPGRAAGRGGGARRPASSSTRRRPTSIRLAPPLVVTDAQLDAFVQALPGVLDAARVAP